MYSHSDVFIYLVVGKNRGKKFKETVKIIVFHAHISYIIKKKKHKRKWFLTFIHFNH